MRGICFAGGALLCAGLLAAPAVAAPAPDALERLRSGPAAERAAAARELGESGAMAHTPAVAALLHDKDAGVREAAREALWKIWMRSGDPEVDAVLAQGVAFMDGGRLEEAIALFGWIVRRRPDFAEGWNKRATALFLAKRYQESLADCRKTLELNPYHFGALFGVGLNYVGLDDFPGAIGAFRRTLEVLPFSQPARRYIDVLEKALTKKERKI